MAKERRRLAELSQIVGLSELEVLLLPLAISLARQTARMDVRAAMQ